MNTTVTVESVREELLKARLTPDYQALVKDIKIEIDEKAWAGSGTGFSLIGIYDFKDAVHALSVIPQPLAVKNKSQNGVSSVAITVVGESYWIIVHDPYRYAMNIANYLKGWIDCDKEWRRVTGW